MFSLFYDGRLRSTQTHNLDPLGAHTDRHTHALSSGWVYIPRSNNKNNGVNEQHRRMPLKVLHETETLLLQGRRVQEGSVRVID